MTPHIGGQDATHHLAVLRAHATDNHATTEPLSRDHWDHIVEERAHDKRWGRADWRDEKSERDEMRWREGAA